MLKRTNTGRVASRLALGVSSVALLTAAGAGIAQAQQGVIVAERATQPVAQVAQAQAGASANSGNDPLPLEEIVVTGFRKSLFDSVEAKRSSKQIVEAISAEDIGKLPDNSIAESLARLPGLTSQRQDGRSQTISVRGLGPDFTTTLLNGREQVSTSNNRSAEFDQYPSELINNVLVYKSAQAGLIGQGLAGTVDLRTIRPLERTERVIAMSARAEMTSTDKLNADSDRYGYRLAGIYVDKFADDTVGIAIGVAHLDQPTQIKDARMWGYPAIEAAAGTPLRALNGARVVGGAEIKANSLALTRTGVTGTLQYEPSDSFNTTLDIFYSKFKDEQIQRGLELPLFWSAAQLQPTGATLTDGFVSGGTYNDVKAVLRSDLRETEADIFSAGWNGQYKSGAWTLTADAAYNTIDRESDRTEIYAGTGRAGVGATDTIGFTSLSDFGTQFAPRLNYADPNLVRLTQPQGWGGDVVPGGQDGYVNRPTVGDDLWSVRGDVDREFDGGFLTNVKFAVNYTNRQKDFAQDEFYLQLRANQAAPNNVSVAIPANLIIDPTDLSWIGLGNTIAFDSAALLDQDFYRFIPCPRTDCIINRWDLEEKVTTAMLRADFETDLGGWTLSGDAGAQVVRTDQSSTGPQAVPGGTVRLIENGKKYTDVLPALNLIFTPPNDDHKIRLSLSRQMARARPDSLRATSTVGFSTDALAPVAGQPGVFTNATGRSPWEVNGGNPELEPWMANAADLAYEYYFAGTGYISIAGFYKDLRTYIYDQNTPFDFTGFTTGGINYVGTRIGTYRRPANGEGGELYGVEVAISLPFEVFSESLEGFGITGNVGMTETNIAPQGPGSSQPIPGFSKWTPQGTFYYDKDGFSARVSVSHRSKFVAEVRGFGEGRDFRRGKAETLVDAQVSYEFQEGSMLDGFSVLLQGYNLTDEPFVTYDNNDPRQVINYQEFGSRYLLGVSYRF
ncbi:MAG: hypothetical protein RLY86_2263 [Pseudomonadota bacterium]|jgi:iron complex outermembrane receptor protein